MKYVRCVKPDDAKKLTLYKKYTVIDIGIFMSRQYYHLYETDVRYWADRFIPWLSVNENIKVL